MDKKDLDSIKNMDKKEAIGILKENGWDKVDINGIHYLEIYEGKFYISRELEGDLEGIIARMEISLERYVEILKEVI